MDGSVFIITYTESNNNLGGKVQRLGKTDEWEDVPSAPTHPVKIDVEHEYAVFVVDILGQLYRYDGEDWILEADDAPIVDVGVGSSGVVYVTTTYGEVMQHKPS